MKQLLNLIIISSIFFGCQRPIEGDLLIENVNLIDVQTGDIKTSLDILIIKDSIATIQKHKQGKYITTKKIDGTNKYLIPGLWDMHVHNWWGYEDFFPLLVANGVTGIREMWGDIPEIKKIRELIEMDSIIGPDMVSAGAIVDGNPPDWEGSDIADTPEKGREIVRNQKESGADFIKVYSNLEKDVYFAIADESKKQNIPMSGHVPNRVTLEEALEAGHQSVEHFYGVLEFLSSRQVYLKQYWEGKVENDTLKYYLNRLDYFYDTYDTEREKVLFDLMEKYQPWMVPTMVANLGGQRELDPNFPYDDRIDYMPQYTTNDWIIDPEVKKDPILKPYLQTKINTYKLYQKLLKPLKTHGARYLAGTDYPNQYTYPGFSIHEEMELFVEAGFSPLEAIQTATLNPAIFLELEKEFGTVEVGKRANLVLLTENPLEDIKNTTKINAVIVRGKYHQGAVLKEKIEAVATYNRMPKIKDEILPLILEQGLEAGIDKYYELKASKPNFYNFNEEQLNSLGYDLLRNNLKEEAVKIFEMNVEIFPNYANGYDSLGDGYMAVGDNQKAKIAWEKAVELGSQYTKDKLKSLE